MSHATGWEGTGPDLMSVVCRAGHDPDPHDSLAVLLVPGPIRGLTITELFDPLGHRAHLLPRFTLTDVRVPEGGTCSVRSATASACRQRRSAAH